MEYECRIVESGHGGFDVQKGFAHKGGERVPGMLGSQCLASWFMNLLMLIT